MQQKLSCMKEQDCIECYLIGDCQVSILMGDIIDKLKLRFDDSPINKQFVIIKN